MRIVGRETELELLTSFARGEGEAGFALVEGEAGVGKTALWSAVIDGLDDVRVLQARPTAAETGAAYAALDDLVRPVRAALASTGDPHRLALAVALLIEPADGPPDQRAVALGLLSLLEELASDAPLLMAVDDWQWLDASSAAVLGFALRRLLLDGARVLATLRSGEADASVRALVRSLPEGRVVELRLDPLTPSELLELVHERTGRWLSPPALERLHRLSGGNALAALELTRAGDGAARHASDVRRLLAARVGALAPEAREVLRCAAALATPTVAAVARAVPAAPGLEEALVSEVLIREGDVLRFSHPLYAAVVEELTPPGDWRALHRRAAGAVTDPEQHARHLAHAATGPDAEVAAALAGAAADATARGAPSSAAELAQRAAELTPPTDAELRVTRSLEAAEAHIRAGDGERATQILGALIDELPPGALRAQALLRMAWVTTAGDDRELAERALAEAGDDDALRGLAHATLANLKWNRAASAAAYEHALRAAECADRCGDSLLAARARLELSIMRFVRGEGVQRELLVEADRLEREGSGPAMEMTAMTGLGLQLYQSGDLEGGRPVLLAELDRAAANVDRASFILLLLADLEVRAGRLQAADEHARRTLELSVGTEIANAESAGLWIRARVDTHLGRVDEARPNAERALAIAKAESDFAFAVFAQHALGFLALSLGDPDEAVRRLAPLPALAARLDVREPMVFGIEPDLAEALVMSGDLEAARAVTAELAAVGRELDRPWAVAAALRCSGLIAAAESRHDDALADHAAAIELFDRIGQPFERARTLLALGTAQRRAKRRGASRASLEAALALFGELGAALWTRRASEEIARLGGRRARDRDELTPTEQRIAALAAEGRSNREIAAELFVSERTVEANLTRAYRKLGVRSRTQLARRLPAV